VVGRRRLRPHGGKGHARLEDILLLFIYLEIGAMVGIYFKTTRLPVRYLIYIAITALAGCSRYDILIVAGAILVLSLAVLVLRYGSHRYPSDGPRADVEPAKAEA
jgi:phosphate starvation-inducible membrane PsiE